MKMKKRSLKNILKKTFNKITTPKSKRKAKVVKKAKAVKKTKVAKNIKVKKNLKLTKTVSNKNNSEKIEVKTDNYRISKSNELKPVIIKVKKQGTEKKRI